MQKLLDFILNSIPENASYPIIFLIFTFAFFIYCLHEINVIYDFIDKFNKRELSMLKDLLADKNISKKAKKTLQSKIDSIVYKNVTGITTDLYLQEKIINYYELTDGRLSYSDFKKALEFLQIDRNGILDIRNPNPGDRLKQAFFIIMSVLVFLSLCGALFGVGLVFIEKSIGRPEAILLLIASVLMIPSGLIMIFGFIREVSLINTAKKIKDEIDNHPLISRYKTTQREFKKTNLEEKKLRPFGLCEGEFTVPDDFDDPLPEDILNTLEGK